MPSQRRIFDQEFKLQLLTEIDAGNSVAETARRHAVHPELIYRWRRQKRKYADRAFAGRGNAYSDEAKIAQLERTCGQLAAENSLLKKAIKLLQELERPSNGVRRSRR